MKNFYKITSFYKTSIRTQSQEGTKKEFVTKNTLLNLTEIASELLLHH